MVAVGILEKKRARYLTVSRPEMGDTSYFLTTRSLKMSRTFYDTNFLRSKQPLPNPCSLRGRHSWLRKTPRAEDASMPGVYRKTCARCGQWREFAGDGLLLLTSED